MVEKVYDNVGSIEELNQIAASLRRIGMKDELGKLAEKFLVPQENITAFWEGKRYYLVDGGNTKKIYDTAKAKLVTEMISLKDSQFGDVIGNYLISCCQDSSLEKQILLSHKTLQRCIGYLMEQAYSMVSDEVKNSRQNTGIAVSSDQVFEWIRDYYFLDDKKQVEKEADEANRKFMKSLEADKKSKVQNKTSQKNSNQKKKKAANSQETSAKAQKMKKVQDQNTNQISLFEAGLTA